MDADNARMDVSAEADMLADLDVMGGISGKEWSIRRARAMGLSEEDIKDLFEKA